MTDSPSPIPTHDGPPRPDRLVSPETASARLVRHAVGALSALLLLSAFLGLWLSVVSHRWVTIGFDAVLIPAGFVGLLIWRGRFREGFGLAILCIAGTAAVSGVLNDATIRNVFKGVPASTVVRTGVIDIDLIQLGLARLGIGVALAGLAAAAVLTRRPGRSLKSLAIGAACGLPALSILVAWARAPIRAHLTGIHPAVTGVFAIVSMVLFIGLVSAAVHMVIRAFQIGVDAADESTGKTATA